MAEKQGGLTLWRYRRQFAVDGVPGCVTLRSRTDGLFSELVSELINGLVNELVNGLINGLVSGLVI